MRTNYKLFKEVRDSRTCIRVGHVAEDALAITRDVRIARDLGLEVLWEDDDDGIRAIEDCDEELAKVLRRQYEEGTIEVLQARVESPSGEYLSSLSGIILHVDSDRSGYEFELLSEALEPLSSTPDDDLETEFDEYLDEVYGECNVAGYSYSTSRVLREIDPVSYRECLNNWIDGELKNDRWIGESNGYYYAES